MHYGRRRSWQSVHQKMLRPATAPLIFWSFSSSPFLDHHHHLPTLLSCSSATMVRAQGGERLQLGGGTAIGVEERVSTKNGIHPIIYNPTELHERLIIGIWPSFGYNGWPFLQRMPTHFLCDSISLLRLCTWSCSIFTHLPRIPWGRTRWIGALSPFAYSALFGRLLLPVLTMMISLMVYASVRVFV